MHPYQAHTHQSFNEIYFTQLKENLSIEEVLENLKSNDVDFYDASFNRSEIINKAKLDGLNIERDLYMIQVDLVSIFFLFRKRK